MSPPVPLMAPEKVVLALPLVVRVLAPRLTAPAPASEPMVSLALRASVAPLETVTAVLLATAAPPLSAKVPADTVIAPVLVLVPESVSVPKPVLARVPLPDRTPDKPTPLALLMVDVPLTVMFWLSVTPLPLICRVVLDRVSAPEPRLLPSLTSTTPPLRALVPV